MGTTRHILSAILILALLSSGLPFFTREDANRDRRVDLEDAIRQVMDFAQTAYEPHDFASTVEKAVSTLRIVAGLKANLKSDNDTKSRSMQLSLDSPYIPSLVHLSFQLETYSQVIEQSYLYQSIEITPDTPPPKLVHG